MTLKHAQQKIEEGIERLGLVGYGFPTGLNEEEIKTIKDFITSSISTALIEGFNEAVRLQKQKRDDYLSNAQQEESDRQNKVNQG